MPKFGITVKFGAAHNSISRNGLTRDLSSLDTQQRRLNEQAMQDGVVALFAKPGADRNRKRKMNKKRYEKSYA